jgi:hypothetical protein
LQYADLGNGICKFLKTFFIEQTPGLVWVRPNGLKWNVAESRSIITPPEYFIHPAWDK